MKKHRYGFVFLFLLVQFFSVAYAAEGGMVVKENCAWEHPGRESSKWGHENALRALRVPEETIKRFATRIQHGQLDGWVDISPQQGVVRQQLGDRPERFTIDGMVFGKRKVCYGVFPHGLISAERKKRDCTRSKTETATLCMLPSPRCATT